ncbi:transglycosylase domain-containing protein [Candidatus Viridilinea mediisalina]|uniref:Penicillin-binding protein n=1 Tax=Candidatus Viridilinea mediisalina TaxID=2024553 RepID=A0A2A6RMM1_9CHLR|nr:PBP1A family penicillin-binding protein [Candidatus Viridilinea mediisalina]PDW04151.1 penicillin-binding protein [Candidatus Viridilinea mediisalina]
MSNLNPSPPPPLRFIKRRRRGSRLRRRYPLLAFGLRLLLALLKLSLLVVLLVALTLGTGATWLYMRYADDLPDPQRMSEHRAFETTRIYARDGTTLLYELIGPQDGRRTPVAFEQIPQMLKDATIAVEDAGFYSNPGVDVRGIIRAALQNYTSGEIVSGASTITMQLVRSILLDPEERAEQSYERKLREAILAYRVSQNYGKDQILNLYLNEVYYGAQAYGVEAAAQAYFAKHVWELNPAEATLLAGLPQAPSVYNPFTNFVAARARQRVTLNLMVQHGMLSRAEAEAIYAEPITLAPARSDIVAPHFVFYVRDQLERTYGPDLLYRAGLRVVTSLDLAWQAEAERIAAEQIEQLRVRRASNAGVVMLAPDGQILAMVGSVDYHASDGQVNVTMAPRQPGSALKPFIYAAAMQRTWTPATIIWDEPTRWDAPGGGVYQPRNYDGGFHGPMRLRMALANSLNIPAVKALEYVGVAAFVDQMSQLGISTFDDPTRYSLAMALGSNEVRLLELTGAYHALLNGGRYNPPVAITKVSNSRGEMLERWQPTRGRAVFGPQSEQIAYLISDILSDDAARHYMFGRGNVMELPGVIAAAKTGTSNDFRDSWALGYSTDVTIGVWVGNNDSSPMQEIAGANGAGQIWHALMLRYHQGRAETAFLRPAGIEEIPVCADTGGRAGEGCPRTISELFLAGSGPSDVDVLYQTVRVAGDGNCLAASYTPAAEVREVRYPIYPAEFQAWAARNAPQPPSEPCPPPSAPEAAVALLNPLGVNGTITTTQIFISGTARGPYTLEVGAGETPAQWELLGQSSLAVEAGLLGVWSTNGLTEGIYTLRLRVATPEGFSISTTQAVEYRQRGEPPQ